MAKPKVIGQDKLGRDIRDYAHGEWWGVERQEIHWGPTVDEDRCVGCGLCYMTCGGRVVYDWNTETGRPIVARFDNCSPGCRTCANLCPTEAITFPDVSEIQAQRDQHDVVAKAHRRVADLKDYGSDHQ